MIQIEKSEIHVFPDEGQERTMAFLVESGLFFELAPVHEAILACCEGVSAHDVAGELADHFGLDEVLEAIGELEQANVISEGALNLLPEIPVLEQEACAVGPDVFHIALHVAHACNISCTYCFAHGGDYGGKPGLMTFEVGQQAVLWALEQAKDIGRCQIDFFGGEPLLNMDLIREIIPFAREQGAVRGIEIAFGMTTNGTLLTDDVRAFLKAENVGVKISIDGEKEAHDKSRKFHDGSDTYDVIAENARKMVQEMPERVYLHATMTSENLDYEAVTGHLRSFGTDKVEAAPIVTSPYMPNAIREEHLPELKAQIRKQSQHDLVAIANGQREGVEFDAQIKKLLTGSKACRGCQGGQTYFSISIDGAIHFCSSLADLDKFRMGDVFNGLDRDVKAQFDDDFHVDNRDDCSTCWARNLCGGGCVYDAQSVNGEPVDPNPVSCAQIKYRYELAMEMCLEIMEYDDTLLEQRYDLVLG